MHWTSRLSIVLIVAIHAHTGLSVLPAAAAEGSFSVSPPGQESQVSPQVNPTETLTTGTLTLTFGSRQAVLDGNVYTAPKPVTVKAGVSYVGLRFITELLGGAIVHPPRTGETVATVNGVEIRLTNNSAAIVTNGEASIMRAPVYTEQNVMMVPITALAQSLNYKVTLAGTSVVLQQKILQPQTPEQQSPEQPLTQEPPAVIPNPAPQAYFETDKSVYRLGEPVRVTDESYDDEEAITETVWTNKQPAYFEPGEITITLTVKDQHGSPASYSRAITITDETLYTEDEFMRLFAPAGQNMAIDGVAVKKMEALPYQITTEDTELIRSSGPESVYEEGILYEDVASGPVRFLLHHKNKMGDKAKLYIVATNMGATTAVLNFGSEGTAGPTEHPNIAGKMSLLRFLTAAANGGSDQVSGIAPGESAVLFDGLTNAAPLPDGQVMTFTGEVNSDAPVRYTVLMVRSGHDPIEALGTLAPLDPVESIVRGTFQDATRVFDYDGLVGDHAVKLSLTDNTSDPFQTGTDGLLGTRTTNSGNYGLMYKLKLRHVAPHTLIAFNPRGGLYTGAALVNGVPLAFSHLGTGSTQNEASILYRTGDTDESVEIMISPAAGSNLPFCLLFVPLPSLKE